MMPRVPVHDVSSAPEDSRPTLSALEERFGKTLNIFGEMAHAPAVLELFVTVESLLRERSSLDPRAREAIHLTVSAVNGCDYCQAAYTWAARSAGFSDEEAIAIRLGTLAADPKLTALLQLARQIAEHKGHVDDTVWQEALEAGWSRRELLDAYADVVRTNLTNYFNHLVGTELDLPAAPPIEPRAQAA